MIQNSLLQWYADLPFQPARIWIAYSGGRDSHVLVHALKSVLPHINFALCHVDHALNVNSMHWAKHCEYIAKTLQIDFFTKRLLSQPAKGESIEAWARQARYDWFKTLLAPNEILCTAHTQNDQVETLLINLMRGSGLNGLSGIADLKAFGQSWLARPLLQIDRQAIDDYVALFKLEYVDDDSNLNLKFERNFLRHSLLPVLKQRYPSFQTTITRTVKHCAEALKLLDELAALDLTMISACGQRIKAGKLANLSYVRQKNVFRYWLRTKGFPLPSEVKIDDILRQIVNAGIDKHPQIRWGTVLLRRVKGEVIVVSD